MNWVKKKSFYFWFYSCEIHLKMKGILIGNKRNWIGKKRNLIGKKSNLIGNHSNVRNFIVNEINLSKNVRSEYHTLSCVRSALISLPNFPFHLAFPILGIPSGRGNSEEKLRHFGHMIMCDFCFIYIFMCIYIYIV